MNKKLMIWKVKPMKILKKIFECDKDGGKVVKTKSSPYFNHEAYADPTAFHGLSEVIKEEKQIEMKVSDLVRVIKLICNLAGFDVIGRLQFKHKKSGREFK